MNASSLSDMWDEFSDEYGLTAAEMAGVTILRPDLFRRYFLMLITPAAFERELRVSDNIYKNMT